MTPSDPSVGMDAETGRIITGWDHVAQSISDILTTSFGERIMREWYGSFIPALLGSQLNSQEVTRFFAAVTSAIEQWEPRYRIVRITPVQATRAGELRLHIDGEYRPRALFGDLTAEGSRRLVLLPNARGLRLVEGDLA